jgi:beta-N-acetylhexosaminidase
MRRVLCLLFPLIFLLAAVQPALAESLQQEDLAQTLLDSMSVEERVGQLFIVSVEGQDLSKGSPIANLITQRHIGGFILRTDRNNFSDQNPLVSAYKNNATLQHLAWDKAQNFTGRTPVYIPLYLGISQTGGMDPEQLLLGMAPLVSQMSLGATWSPERAKDAGAMLGSNLNAMGFNLFIGPNLDVVETGTPAAEFSGTNTFGGNPYWVGQLAQGYINGIHSGSFNRLQVFASHFPGLGSADRNPDQEVSTVQKSIEDLLAGDLTPYLAVTGSTEKGDLTDGLVVSHLRLQDFQGLASTRPISLDAEALTRLYSLEPLAAWRAQGGLSISEDLGSSALRLFLDPASQNYDAVGIARQAFMAGNDLLYLNHFKGVGDESEFETIGKTLDSFTQKYQEDPLFAEKVNAAVLRILQAKLRLYGNNFDIKQVVPPEVAVHSLESQSGVNRMSADVVRESAALLSPSAEYLRSLLPEPPGAYDYIVTFTDQRSLEPCSNCNPIHLPAVRGFQDALLRLYGPLGTRQLSENRLFSYSFEQLLEFVESPAEPTTPYMADNLKRADWVVFFTAGADAAHPASMALQRVLNESFEILRDKRIIVFAYGDPYGLDTTAISKLTAYYGLFGKSQAYTDMAARILMQEATPQGAAPVSLPMVGYNLARQTEPNPAQVIPISLLTAKPLPSDGKLDPESTPVPLFRRGESVRIQAGAIRDRNMHLVPDGTEVQFTIKLAGEGLIIAQPSAVSSGGLAIIDYTIDRDGIFEVTAASGEASTSGTLILNTHGGLAEVIMPTATPTQSPTAIPQPSPSPEPAAEPTPVAGGNLTGYPRMQDWLLMIMLLVIGFGLAYALGYLWWGSNNWGLRAGYCTVIGGLSSYLLLTFGITPLMRQMQAHGVRVVVLAALIGMLLGLVVAFVWWFRTVVPLKRSFHDEV